MSPISAYLTTYTAFSEKLLVLDFFRHAVGLFQVLQVVLAGSHLGEVVDQGKL